MANGYKLQIVAAVIIFLLTIHNLYLKSELVSLLNIVKTEQIRTNLGDHQKQSHSVLIYNRIPKTGSTSFMNVAYELYKLNNFRVVGLHVSHFKHQLTTGDQRSLSQNMSQWSDLPSLYHGHFAYFDPKRVGADLTPLYINMVRNPLERLVSHYYFLRYGDDVLVKKVRAKEGDTTTFDECVAQQLSPDCDPKRMWIQIPFFCGMSAQCWEPGSEWALAQAKTNLVSRFLVVGVTEQFETFIEVLEELLPQYFTGATKFLQDSGKAHIKHTRHKDPLSEKTIDKMKKTRVWKLENDFYNFALKQFNSVKTSTLEQKSLKTAFYNYEKVRPK